MPVLRRTISLIAPVLLAMLYCAEAQEIGGYTGAFMRAADGARERSLGGAFVPFGADASTIFTNSAALTEATGLTTSFSASFLPYHQQFVTAGVSVPVGRAAGIGAGIVRYGISDVPMYTENGTRVGVTSSQELSVAIGGGLRIGPGAVGTTLHYLRFDAPGAEGAAGYAVDLSGLIRFDGAFTGNDWVFAAVSLNNVAGEQTGAHRLAAANARLSAAYLYPLGEDVRSQQRLDPIGAPVERRELPESYVMGVIETRVTQFDPLPPSLGLAAEWAPAGLPGALRLGWNSRTMLTFGFALRLRGIGTVDVGATGDGITNAIAFSTTVSLTL